MAAEIVKWEPENVAELMRRATDVAGVCKAVVAKTARDIHGRRYVQVEGWQSIAAAFGCTITVPVVEAVEGGVRAVARLLRQPDGAMLAEAEGFVGDDEAMWAKRPMYARRAMAQTRAQSRVCRSVFAFVVTLMDAGLQTTPAEEVPEEDYSQPPAPPPWPQPTTPQTTAQMTDALKASLAQQAYAAAQRQNGVTEADAVLAAVREAQDTAALSRLVSRIQALRDEGAKASLRAAWTARSNELRGAP